MMRLPGILAIAAFLGGVLLPGHRAGAVSHPLAPLRLSWASDFLTIRGPQVAGGELKVRYMEAYCRSGSTNRDWRETVIDHKTEAIEAGLEGRTLKLRSTLKDGVVVDHVIRAGIDEIDFNLTATNPTDIPSDVQWAQPCIRVARFTGVDEERNSESYLPKCFIFLAGKLARMPTQPWTREARYVPGQVWCPRKVNRNDVNPRPLSQLVPSNGLIGCFSANEKSLLATAWEPYQELFQGIIVCLHSDFRIGGLKAGETKRIRGKIYLVEADVPALLRRYKKDFPHKEW